MKRTPSTIRILKLAAAQRQLDAAIRISFADEDPLAINTVASAAYQLLHDIRKHRGHRVLADEWTDSVLGAGRALARGELAAQHLESFKQDERFWSLISALADQIREIGTDTKISELRSLLRVQISHQAEAKHWREFKKAANFLKHADNDPDRSLDEKEVNPDRVILAACNLYFDCMGRLTPEMAVWSVYRFYVQERIALPDDPLRKRMAEALQVAAPSDRNSVAMELILILKGDSRLLDKP